MKKKMLLDASRRYYRKSLLSLGIAGFIASALISADFLAGNSVKKSIETHNLTKTGITTHLISAAAPFGSDLADRIKAALGAAQTAPWLEMPLISVTCGGTVERGLSAAGIDERFTAFFPDDISEGEYPHRGEIWLNRGSAKLLGCSEGDRISLRVPHIDAGEVLQPAARSLSEYTDRSFTVTKILDERGIGRFQTTVTQSSPLLFFANLNEIADCAGIPGTANRIVIHLSSEEPVSIPGGIIKPSDLGCEFRRTENGTELVSSSLYIPDYLISAARSAAPEGTAVYSSFINNASGPGGSRAYLFFISDDRQNTTLISPLLSESTKTQSGGSLTLSYYVYSPKDGSLTENEKTVTVDGSADDSFFISRKGDIPDFPGLTEGKSCREWDSSIPIDLSRINESIERDWAHNGKRPLIVLKKEDAIAVTPDPVAFRFPPEFSEASAEEAVTAFIDPLSTGIRITPLRKELRSASKGSVDFTALFLSMSFFLITAVLFLHAVTVLRFIGLRRNEAGLFRSAGFTRQSLLAYYIREISPVMIISGITGSLAGILLVRLILLALRSVWYGIVHTDALSLYNAPWIIPAAFAAGTLPAFILTSFVINSRLKRMSAGEIALPVPGIKRGTRTLLSILLILLSVLSIALLAAALTLQQLQSALSFLSGSILLTAMLCAFPLLHAGSSGRSRAIVTVSALSFFLVAAVSANRRIMLFDPQESRSPTGGRAYIVETELPVPEDRFPRMDGGIIPFYTYGNTTANCLNLNDIEQPGILGVDTELMDSERIFTLKNGKGREVPWSTLSAKMPDGTIPAAVDSAVLQWSLRKKPGDRIGYTGKDGKPVILTLKALVNNTSLQGRLYIDRRLLYGSFDSGRGAEMFLVSRSFDDDSRRLAGRLFSPWGGRVRSTVEMLTIFMELENTYLRIFQTISSLAVIPGIAGLALMIRGGHSEDAAKEKLMRALGFPYRILQRGHFRRYAGLLVLSCAVSAAALPPVLVPLLQGGNAASVLRTLALFYGPAIAAGVLIIGLLGRLRKPVL